MKTAQYEDLLQVLYFLFELAKRDRRISSAELAIIVRISDSLGISDEDFKSIKAMFIKERKRTYNFKKYTSSYYKLQKAYKVLGVDKNTPFDLIKRAYHELAKKHHPDKLNYLGEVYRISANKKFQEIVNAYNIIKKDRRIK